MLSIMQNPYDEVESNKSFAKGPINQDKSYKTFCGTWVLINIPGIFHGNIVYFVIFCLELSLVEIDNLLPV